MKPFLFALTFAASVATCAEPAVDYCPLPANGKWTYDLQIAHPDHTQIAGTLICRLDGEVTIEGKTYVRIVNATKGVAGMEASVGFYRRAPDGVYFRADDKAGSPDSLLLPDPPTVGKTWTTDFGNAKRVSRIEKVESAELPDRKYEQSIKISFTLTSASGELKGYEYRAPGVGQVRQVLSDGKTPSTGR